MDEKTEELRDIFMDVSEEETVTESQVETRGSISAGDEDVDAAVRETVAEMRDRYDFETDLDIETYVDVVRAFYDVDSVVENGDGTENVAANSIDDRIAGTLDGDLDAETVFRARLDLHLLAEADTDGPVDPAELRRRDGDDDTDAESLADEFGVDVATVERCRAIVAAQDEMRAANHRYREAFDELLTDMDLEGGYTDDVQQDGLREAAEDIETNTSF
jgi:hypothetical protein